MITARPARSREERSVVHKKGRFMVSHLLRAQRVGCLIAFTASIQLLLFIATASAQLDLSGGGLTLVQEGPAAPASPGDVPNNLALGSNGASAFASSDLGPEINTPYHFTENLNDGFYGNEFSWIGGDDNPFFPDAFAGIDLGAAPVMNIQSIAFGRSNVLSGDVCGGGGVCQDRHKGFYVLQYTQVPNPSSDHDLPTGGNPAVGWSEIGTLDYGESDGESTNYNVTWQRHRYNFDPVNATGIRLLVPGSGLGGGTAIDEIELYVEAGDEVEPPPPPPPFAIVPEPGFSITWDGNDGDQFDPEVPPDGAVVPDNLALADNGAVAFASSDLGPQLGIGFHITENINDGFYGNSNSWIGGDDNPFAPIQFAGVNLGDMFQINTIAWGRDNGNGEVDDSFPGTDACGGQCDDRSPGLYTIQYTSIADANADTEETGDASTGWRTIGSLTYNITEDRDVGGGFTPFLRHEYEVMLEGQPIPATAVRLLVPRTGLGGGTAIDELEVYGQSGGGARLQAGDADQDLDFDQIDLVQVAVAAKYLTGQAATWGEGDWNAAPGGSVGSPPVGDGIFNQIDIIAALSNDLYLTGPYGAIATGGQSGDAQTSLIYDPTSGELKVDTPAGKELTSINITSSGARFTGGKPASLDGAFDNFAADNLFKATFGGSFGSISFGTVLATGLSEAAISDDLSVVGSLAGGGDLGEVDLIYLPEPTTFILLGFGLSSALIVVRRHKARR